MKDNTTIGYKVTKVDDENVIDSDIMVELSAELSCYLRSISSKYKNVNQVKIILRTEVESLDDEAEGGE